MLYNFDESMKNTNNRNADLIKQEAPNLPRLFCIVRKDISHYNTLGDQLLLLHCNISIRFPSSLRLSLFNIVSKIYNLIGA